MSRRSGRESTANRMSLVMGKQSKRGLRAKNKYMAQMAWLYRNEKMGKGKPMTQRSLGQGQDETSWGAQYASIGSRTGIFYAESLEASILFSNLVDTTVSHLPSISFRPDNKYLKPLQFFSGFIPTQNFQGEQVTVFKIITKSLRYINTALSRKNKLLIFFFQDLILISNLSSSC